MKNKIFILFFFSFVKVEVNDLLSIRTLLIALFKLIVSFGSYFLVQSFKVFHLFYWRFI